MGVVHLGVVHPEPVPDGAHVGGGVDGVGPLVQRLLVRLLRATTLPLKLVQLMKP